MTPRAVLAAAMLACTSSLFAVPCGATEAMQQKGVLPRGGSYVLDPNPTLGAAAIALWFRAPGAGYDNATPGIARLAATAAAVAPLASGKSLAELVRTFGGELNINVYPDIVGIGVVVPSAAARRAVAAMTAAYFAPAIDAASVKTAQRDAAVLAVQQRYSVDLTLHDLLFKQMFSSGPAHYSPLPDSVAQIARIAPDSVATFAKRAFRSGNGVLTLAGNVDASSISAVTDGSGNGMDAPYDSMLSGVMGTTTAAGSVQGVGLAWVGPPISDEKAATALDFIADYLFRDETGVVTRALGARDAYVVGQFITLHDPGIMLVTIGGSEGKNAKQQVLDQLGKMTSPMDRQTFAAALEAFLYHIASDTQTPQEQADNLGWYAVEGSEGYAPGDAGGEYERNARTLDPQYVSDIVRKYLMTPVTVNLIATPEKGSAS
ncbi:MAG: insulinase family protein [Candidatus Eremiobacteraeota bacterium]|nr:insulinase family protein [Candidatus Eremiobacteraeota bacterium]